MIISRVCRSHKQPGGELARIMHKFSTASPKSLVLTVLRSVGLYSTLAWASVARLVRPALSALRDENLCIIRALVCWTLPPLLFTLFHIGCGSCFP